MGVYVYIYMETYIYSVYIYICLKENKARLEVKLYHVISLRIDVCTYIYICI
jgi:hypothetical protein